MFISLNKPQNQSEIKEHSLLTTEAVASKTPERAGNRENGHDVTQSVIVEI